ncbi:MAG: hypothetical protein JRD93_02070 [Deltaproteobacteria bacterium]|nr:hypothetical protein [Deltaproteobacteria bacterium]
MLKNKFTLSEIEASARQDAMMAKTGCLTDEQRNHAGWLGASKCEVVFE